MKLEQKLVLPQTITIKWTKVNKKYYENKNYNFTYYNDNFDINVLDLSQGSHEKVKCYCYFCNNEILKEFRKLQKTNNKFDDIICCKKCQSKKNKMILMDKYGVEHQMHLKETKEKIKQTCLEKYGVENPAQSEEIKEKTKQTCLEKYGTEYAISSNEIKEKINNTFINKYNVNNPMQIQEVKEKIIITNLNKYGKKYPLQSYDVRQKVKQTNIAKYGCENPMQYQPILEKAMQTMYKNGCAPSSEQQRHIQQLIGGELNYPVNRCFLDIAFPEELIDIEYDGGGHNLGVKKGEMTQEEFNNHEIKRDKFLKSLGWKIIRIICNNDKLLKDNNLINLIENAKQYLLTSNHTWINIDINNMIVYHSKYKTNI